MNKHWKIAFCGLGSIGTRHLRNIRQILDVRGDCRLVLMPDVGHSTYGLGHRVLGNLES